MHTVRDQITLTSEEQELFDLLLAAAKHAGTNTTLRCAGGWVRDKLLGKDSKDIDVALDNMLGRDFADKVRFLDVDVDGSVDGGALRAARARCAASMRAACAAVLAFLPALDNAALTHTT